MSKAQGGAHGRQLHVLHVEAERQVAHVRAVAGAVRMQRWWSASERSWNDTQACTHRGNWPGGLAQSKPAWTQAGFKMNWTALSSGSGLVNLFQYSKYFPIAFNLFQYSKYFPIAFN
jgi:hypothetical protein